MNKLKKLGYYTFLTQILNFVPFVIITLYFDKLVYGEFATNISVISILGITSVLKLDIYNIEKNKQFKFQQILKYLIIVWVISYCVLWFNNLIVFLGIMTIISIGLYDYTAHCLLQNNLIDKFNRFRLARVVIILISYNLFWLFEVSVTLLILIELLSKFIPFLLFYPHQNVGDKISNQDVINTFKISFSWFINNSVILLIPFILSNNVELEELGWYYIFFKGINQVEVLLASTFNQYLISESQNNLLNDYIKKLLIYGCFLFISILMLGMLLIFVISNYFNFYTDLFLFAMIITFLSGIGSPFYVILNKLKLSNFQFKWDMIRFIIFVLIILLASQISFNYFLFGFPLLLFLTYFWLHFKIISSKLY